MMRLAPIAIAALLHAGCLRAGAFRCDNDADCVRAGVGGRCEAVGFCSFPDPNCSDGRRFGELSGGYAGQCVDVALVVDAAVDTPPGYFTIGGTVSGLTGTGLVLRNNGTDDRSIANNGSFTFATALMMGQMYQVTVGAQPSNQVCNVADGSGTVASANVTDVAVSCFDPGANLGILCAPATYCTLGSQYCCFDRAIGTGTCQALASSCQRQRMECDGAADCGGGSNVCCGRFVISNGNLADVLCKSSESACLGGGGASRYEVWCDPADPSPCPAGKTCTGATGFTGYFKCQ